MFVFIPVPQLLQHQLHQLQPPPLLSTADVPVATLTAISTTPVPQLYVTLKCCFTRQTEGECSSSVRTPDVVTLMHHNFFHILS